MAGRKVYPPIKIGDQFERWTVVEPAEPRHRQMDADRNPRQRWWCVCVCGTGRSVIGANLNNGISRSCGCLVKDVNAALKTTHGFRSGDRRSGKIKAPEYETWRALKKRCCNPNEKDYFRYGGRGIVVCFRWLDGDGIKGGFECFLDDMGNRPSPEHSIDRIDVNGDYEPENCRWATSREQARNRRTTILVGHEGRMVSLKEAAIASGLSYETVHARKRTGIHPDQWLQPAREKSQKR